MENIFKALRKDHDKQRDLLNKLLKTSGDTKTRHAFFFKLKDQLQAHAKYEERVLYKPMMDIDNTQEKARHSIAEHKDIDDLIEKLEDTDMSSPSWIATVKDLEHQVLHHLKEEEQEVFKSAGHAFSESEKVRFAKDYNEGMQASI